MDMFTDLHLAYFCIAAVFLSVSCALYSLLQGRTTKPQNKSFITMLILIALGGLMDMLYTMVHPLAGVSHTLFIWQEAFQLSYFVTHAAMGPLFAIYVMQVNGMGREKNRLFYVVYLLPFFLVEALVISNPFTHTIYTYDEANVYVRNSGANILYVISFGYILYGIFALLFFWNAVTVKIRRTILYFFILVIIGAALQFLFPDVKLELFAEALAMLGIMLTVEDESDRQDPLTGVYNRRGLELDLDNFIKTKNHFRMISLRFTNQDVIQRVLTTTDFEHLNRDIAEFLSTLVPKYYIYRPDNLSFALLEMRKTDVDTVERLKERFDESWKEGGFEVTLNAAIICARIPEELQTVEEVFRVVDSPVAGTGETQVLRSDEMNTILRRSEVETAIRRAISNRSFQVYYQPIFDASKKKIVTAEALVRLIDPEMGFISPGEFIPIAEADGLVNDVDMIVLEKVCDFEKRHPLQELGLEHIHINLSAYQLMYHNFMEEFTATLQRYGIPSDGINIEITESADITSSDDIRKGLDELKNRDFEISLDDYGTGYSNLSNVLQMNYRNIKLDKSLLDAASDATNKTMLLETIRMIRKVDINVIQEGVETEEQLELVMEAGCDLIQGFYFSKPLPEDLFLEYLKNFKWTRYISSV